MKHTAIACLFAILSAAASASDFPSPETVGLHVGKLHSAKGFCSDTPGAYAKWGNGVTIGLYRNSECAKYSAYAGYTWQTSGAVRFAVTVGAVTGYKLAAVLPLVVPSVAIDVARDVALRVTYVPKMNASGAHALNFAIEQTF